MTTAEKIEQLQNRKNYIISKFNKNNHISVTKSLESEIDLINTQMSILNGNVPDIEADCIFDLEGNLVTAKKINGKFGLCWVVESEEMASRYGKFISIPKQEKTYAKKGLKSGKALLKPWAYIESNYFGESVVLYPVQKYYWESL